MDKGASIKNDTIVALDRAVRNMNVNTSSVYDERGVLVI